ncbi:MAG TPA: Asp-tRNA(Asn)/Glu-tRNA(Gln) amidotransferase subunit GatC [Acidobacteriota bacterium]|nr:Asp-tRNA(Asn)/Glu-tRNA(Gln) amidotransferase subunit GatC [Acidobacteriota bacterium]
MKVDKEVVQHIARLAHLELDEKEIEPLAHQLQDILQYIEKLKEVGESAEPFSYDFLLTTDLRPDQLVPSLSVEEALKNAPEHVKNFFKVPRILP